MNPVQTIKILYVEDDRQHVEMIIQMLNSCKRIKFEIEHRGDLKSSIEYLNSINCNIDAVLLDLMLPNSAGVNTFKKVYNTCVSVPIVIISAHEDIAQQCISIGAQDYLVKPDISPQLISRAIRYAIERKKNNIKIKENEERFKLLSEANFEGVAITRDGIILDINQQFADMVGCSTDEMIGKSVIEYVAPESRDLVMSNLNKRYEHPYEHIAQRKDGSCFPVEIHGRSLANGLRLTAVRDMTRYKEAEQRYKELVEATGASIYEIDFITMKFTYVNDVMCKLTGWSREELLEVGPIEFLTEKGVMEFSKRMESLKRGEHISDAHEYKIKIKDGSFKWTIITASFKEDEKGNVLGASVVAIDITEKKQAQFEAEQKEEIIFSELESRIRQWKDELVSNSVAQQNKIRDVRMNIESMTTDAEVH